MSFRSSLLLTLISLLLPLEQGEAGALAKVASFRYWTHTGYTRIVFELSQKSRYEVMLISGPDRLVLDIQDAKLATDVPPRISGHAQLRGIRTAPRNGNDLRVVLDLNMPVKPRTFMLPPEGRGKPYRLALDLYPASGETLANAGTEGSAKSSSSSSQAIGVSADERKPARAIKTAVPIARDLIIAIDAGHGGHDPGATGPRGTREKDIVLSIAQRLARLVLAHPGMTPVLIRDQDEFVELRDRQLRARAAQADMFVSIHADAFVKSNVHGSSVFVLSNRGASSETAKWLARKENEGYQLAGIDMGGRDRELKQVLLDLSMTATREASQKIASSVLGQLGRVGTLHNKTVQNAGFAVLKSPDIPSILVETAFISNPREESKLRTSRYQNMIARAIHNGIVSYFAEASPPGTRVVAVRSHTIAKGETLSEIADLYGISTKALRTQNSLSSSRIRIGQVLQIPAGS